MKNLTHRFKVHQQSTWFKLLLPTYLVLISLLLLTNDTFAQITQVGTATTANNSGTTITITNPAGIQVGDVLLANIVPVSYTHLVTIVVPSHSSMYISRV